MGKTMAEHLQARRLLLAQLRLDGDRHVRRSDLRAPMGRRDDEGRAGQGGRRVRHVLDPRLSVLHLPRSRRRSGGRQPQGVRPQPRRDDRDLRQENAEDRNEAPLGHRQSLQPPALSRGRRHQSRPGCVRLRRGPGEERHRRDAQARRRQLRALGRPRGLRDPPQHRSASRAGSARALSVAGRRVQAQDRLQGRDPGRAEAAGADQASI